MRAIVHGTTLLLVLLLCGGMAAAQQEDVMENPPDPGGQYDPGGADGPSPWPLFVSLVTAGPATFSRGPDTGYRYIQRETDGTFTVNLGEADLVRSSQQEPMTMPGLRIRNAVVDGTANKQSLEVSWFDDAGALIRVDVLIPGESAWMELEGWQKVEVRLGSEKVV